MAEFVNNALVFVSSYVWGSSTDPEVSPDLCMETLPFLDGPCLSVLATKLVGTAIICGAAVNKAPVLYNVYGTKSGSGLSITSVYAEAIMYSNSMLYGLLRGNPFTAYGENAIVALQTMVLVVMLWRFKSDPYISITQRTIAAMFYVCYIAGAVYMLRPEQQYLLHTVNWFALVFSRGSQFVSTGQLKHTGNQSIITISMNLMGSVVRIATTLKEVGLDMAMLGGYFISVFLNFSLAIQYFVYQENTKKFLDSLAEKKAK